MSKSRNRVAYPPTGSKTMSKVEDHQIDSVANAFVIGDKRLTKWEREFIGSLMDRRLLDRPENLTAKQCDAVLKIYDKVSDVPPI